MRPKSSSFVIEDTFLIVMLFWGEVFGMILLENLPFEKGSRKVVFVDKFVILYYFDMIFRGDYGRFKTGVE